MAGEPPLSSCEVCHCSRAHVRVQGCGHVLHGGCAGSSWPLSECPVCQAPCASIDMLNKLRRESAPASSVRHGRWTLEEERYADALIEDFIAGRLLLPSETKLVHFLKGVLHRTPAGVNRKFPKCKSLCYGGFKGPGTAWTARQQQLQELEGIHLIAAMQCTVGTSHDGELAAALTCEWQRLLADFCVEVEQPFEGSAAWAKANRSRRNRKVRQLRQQQEQRAQDGNDLAAAGSVVHIHTDDSDGNEVGAVTPPPLSVTSATTPPPASDRGHVEPPPQQQRISPAAATASSSGDMPGAWVCVAAADRGAGAGTKRSRSMTCGSGGSGGGEALLLDSAAPAAVVAAADDALAAHGTLVPWPLHMSDQGALEPADHDECGSSSDSSASQHSMAVKLEHCAPVQPQQQQQRSTSAQQQQQRTTSVLQQQQQQQREHNERCLDMWRHKRAPVSARRNFFDESLFDQMCSLIYNYKALSVMNPSFMEDSVVPLVLQVMSACSEDTAMWLIDLGQDMTIRAVTDGIAALELRPEDLEGHKLRALRGVNAMFHPDDRAEFVQLRKRCCQDVSQAVTESADSATGGQIHTHARHWLKHTQCVRFRCNPLANGWADMVEAGTAPEDGYDCLKIERFFCTNRFLLLMDRVVMRGPSSRAPFGPPMSSFFTDTWPVPGNAFIKHGSWGLPRLTPRPRGGSGDYGGIKRHRAASYDAAAAAAAPVRQQLPPQHARLPPHLDARHSAQQQQQRSSQQQLSPVLPFASAPGKSSWHAPPPPLPTYALPPQQPASPYQHHHMHAPFGSYGNGSSSSSVFGLTGGGGSASGMMPAATLASAEPAPSLGDDEMAIWNQLFELIGASEAGVQSSAAAAAPAAAAAAAARFAPAALDPSPLAAALPLPLSPAAAAIDDCDYADVSLDGAGCDAWDAVPPAAALPVASLWGDHDSALAAL